MSAVTSLSCQELVELVTDYLEGVLPSGELRRFEEHIAHCADCTRYLEQMQITIRATGALSGGDLSPEAEDALLRVFGAWRFRRD